MIKVGINGFGRIGRAIGRQVLSSGDLELTAINELDPDINNLAYLLKYDSTYGRFSKDLDVDGKRGSILCSGKYIKIYSHEKIDSVPWEKHGIDVLIDSTGVRANVVVSRSLVKKKVPRVIITHSPAENDVDYTMILGVNEDRFDPKKHKVISSSICDATALAPVVSELDKAFGIKNCFITTLHPWLSYQNLLDGFVSSVSSPGHFWKDYSLGRNSTLNLISKDTTAASAILKAVPQLKGKIDAISFRVPTNIVCASDLSIMVKTRTRAEDVNALFKSLAEKRRNIFEVQEECLVSSDHLGTNKSAIIDAVRTRVMDSKFIKMVVWYDNEWGYSSKVVEIARIVSLKKIKKDI
jgi:glyceraldehyde 3-phosphate dehydrogenase